jgi:hypothetical protein
MPPDELIQQLRAMPAEDRENVLTSLAEKRPTFVARIRQMLAQAPIAENATDEQAEQETAQAQAAQAAAAAGYDPLEWMQGAQGLSLLDFLNPVLPAAQPEETPPAADDFQSQTAMSAYLSNKTRL